MKRPLTPFEPNKPILERAFELARAGSFVDLQALEAALKREGYPYPDRSLTGPTLRKQLRGLLANQAASVRGD